MRTRKENSMQCHECKALGDHHSVDALPVPVKNTLVRKDYKTASLLCWECLRDFAEANPIGRTKSDHDCSSHSYACPRQTSALRRQRKLLEPPCKDFARILGTPVYAPLRSICNPCYQLLQKQSEALTRASPHSPAKIEQSEEAISDLFDRVKLLSVPDRKTFLLLCKQMGYSDSQINASIRDTPIREQLRRLADKTTTGSPSPRRLRQVNVDNVVWNFWLENARPDDGYRSVMSTNYVTGKTSREVVLRVREPFIILWAEFSKQHELTLSYPSFCRRRPRHVKPCSKNPRCRCRWHMQAWMFVKAYNKLPEKFRAFDISRLSELSKSLCDAPSFDCYFGKCSSCPKTFFINNAAKSKVNVEYQTFRSVKIGKANVMRPSTESCTLRTFTTLLKSEAVKYLKHHHAHVSSVEGRRLLASQLRDTDCILHVDYAAKFVHEIYEQVQTDNFNKVKSSIFVAVIGTRDASVGMQYETHYYISDDLSQRYTAVMKILDHLVPQLDYSCIHVFSDGANHFKVADIIGWLLRTNFNILWNYFPTGHGNGLWDNEASHIKQFAATVMQGAEKYDMDHKIVDARSLFEYAKANMKPPKEGLRVKKRVFHFVPDLNHSPGARATVALPGIRSNFFCFSSRAAGTHDLVDQNTVGYRHLTCYCEYCVLGAFLSCTTPGAGVFKVLGAGDSKVELHDDTSSEEENSSSEDSTDSEDTDSSSPQEKGKGGCCSTCGRKGHYAPTCRVRLVNDETSSEDSDEGSEDKNSSEDEDSTPDKSRTIKRPRGTRTQPVKRRK